MTFGEVVILFVLPFVLMPVVMLFIGRFFKESANDGRTGRLENFNDFHREAYVGSAVTAFVTVVAFEIRGGPEPFVLVWLPLLTTVMVLPFGYTIALALNGLFSKKAA